MIVMIVNREREKKISLIINITIHKTKNYAGVYVLRRRRGFRGGLDILYTFDFENVLSIAYVLDSIRKERVLPSRLYLNKTILNIRMCNIRMCVIEIHLRYLFNGT